MKNAYKDVLRCLSGGLLLVMVACSPKSGGGGTPVNTDPINTYFDGEVRPPATSPCFQGAYYYKLMSAVDAWRGITGTVTLPAIRFDSTRTRPNNNRQFLDNPSVYMGGNANGQETDIGMTWEVIRDASGAVTPDRRAFRPFLRRTGYSATGQPSLYINAPALPAYYWYPGETVTMTVKTVANGVVQFTVQGASKSFDTLFAADGFTLTGNASFKRVNAIDQVGREGLPVQPTKTMVSGAQWAKTSLLRLYNGSVVEAPMHPGRYVLMRCPDPKYFTMTATTDETKRGAGSLTIDGDR